jgi:hypothetical protein
MNASRPDGCSFAHEPIGCKRPCILAARSLFPWDLMYAFEVSTRVNSPKNSGPELIEPVVTCEER